MTSTLKTATNLDTTAITPAAIANAADVVTPLEEAETAIDTARERLSVSAADTYMKNLADAVVGITNKTKVTIITPAGDEQLQLDLDAGAAAANEVPKADGAGDWGWGAFSGGTAQDLEGTAGENLAFKDMVYLDESGNDWFKIDTDATPVKIGRWRGCVLESGGITSASTGTIRLVGPVSGFTSLTAGGRVWADTTTGGFTQTKPVPTVDGVQIVIADMGYAVSTTEIYIEPKVQLTYTKRANLTDTETLTIEHHADEPMVMRSVRAHVDASGDREFCSIRRWSSTETEFDVAVRFDDGAGANPDTKTTFKNVSGGTFTDCLCIVEIP